MKGLFIQLALGLALPGLFFLVLVLFPAIGVGLNALTPTVSDCLICLSPALGALAVQVVFVFLRGDKG